MKQFKEPTKEVRDVLEVFNLTYVSYHAPRRGEHYIRIYDASGEYVALVTMDINPKDLESLLAYAGRQYNEGIADGIQTVRTAIRKDLGLE